MKRSFICKTGSVSNWNLSVLRRYEVDELLILTTFYKNKYLCKIFFMLSTDQFKLSHKKFLTSMNSKKVGLEHGTHCQVNV